MESTFKIVPCLTNSSNPVTSIEENSLILIVKLDNMDFGKIISQFNDLFLGQELSTQKVKINEIGSQLLLKMKKVKNSYALVINVGNMDIFNCRTIIEITKLAVNIAIQKSCCKLIIPILPNRMTSSCLNLKGTAVLMAKTSLDTLSQFESFQNQFEVIFWSSAQAKVNLQKGLDIVSNSDNKCNSQCA